MHMHLHFTDMLTVLIHFTDMLTVLSLVKAPTQKMVAVSADLNSKRLKDLVLALAVIHVHITGPFWQMSEFDAVTVANTFNHRTTY